MKNWATKGENLHMLKFCCFSRFCKHAKFSKVNAKFSKVVDFFFSTNAFFC